MYNTKINVDATIFNYTGFNILIFILNILIIYTIFNILYKSVNKILELYNADQFANLTYYEAK